MVDTHTSMTPEPGTINYSLHRLNAEQAERKHIVRLLASLAEDFHIRGQRVLELGSGIGQNLAVFAPDNDVLGIEGLESAADQAGAAGIPTVVANLDRDLPLPNESRHWILALDVLEHLVSPERCLAEANRVLVRGGHLVVNLPNHFTLTARLRMLIGDGLDARRFFPESADWNYPHIRFFRRESVYSLLGKCGFAVIKDLSYKTPAVPMSTELTKLGLGSLPILLARWRPQLFCSGFFLVALKRDDCFTEK